MTQGSNDRKADSGAKVPDTGEPPKKTPTSGASLEGRVDAALAAPPQTMLGGVGALASAPATGTSTPAAGAPAAKGTALMHAASPPDTGPTGAAAPAPNTLVAGSGSSLEGRVIKGRYLIKRLLGEGGMGGVYEGEHIEIGRRVAIKVVSSHHARDPHIAARIKQEARSTSAIESEHIVQVFDAGEDDDVGLFLVMELLKGEDLSALLSRQGGKGLPPVMAISFMAQAAQGLARAHAARIVHRDLKPANIFICSRDDGTSFVKLVDFGIAKLLRDAKEQEGGGLTRMGMVIGTPQYMSPEQAQGLPSVDHRTDIYSLGAVLFEVVSGQSPFPEMPTYEQTILQIMMKQAPRISTLVPDVDPLVDQLCADMMAHDAANRPQEMSQVRDRLQRILAEMGGSSQDITGAAPHDASGGWRGSGPNWRGSVSGADDPASKEAAAAAKASRPGTHAALAVDPNAHTGDEVPSVAGLPRKRSGVVVVAAVLGLAAIVGAFALVRGSGAPQPTAAASGSFGLVQGAAAGSAGPANAPASAPSSAPAAPSAQAAVAPAAPSASVAAPTPPPSAVAAAAPAPEPAKPAGAAPAAPAVKHKPPPAAPTKPGTRRVGATEMQEDF
jgi:serine/threonine-protein kinase